ncbi:MAG: asparagine synthase (glutamine-hydrolyzing) [Elusimicrobiota bacterium]
MCGICGFVSSQSHYIDPISLLQSMTDVIQHRGPDDQGHFTSQPSVVSQKNTIVALGARRLAIIDINHGKQPMSKSDLTTTVVFNGEIYNFQELRRELQNLGYTFKTKSDTEILVHAYDAWGVEMIQRLNGMFAFALWDKKKDQLVLTRDRMGIKPLYYSIIGKNLVFGSEIKSLLKFPSIDKEIDPLAIDDFFSLRYIPTPRTIYKSIRKLEPATTLIWQKGSIRFQQYWTAQHRKPEDKGISYYLEKLDSLLASSVKRQMVSDVPLGAFLSGGLDSPTISYYAKKINPDLLTFNIYFSDKSFSERKEAKQVSEHLKTKHIEMEVNPHIVPIIPLLIDSFDEPFSDDSMIPSYFLTKLAREHMTVALSGDGGDELLGGYTTYLADQQLKNYHRLPLFLRSRVIKPFIQNLPTSYSRVSWDFKLKAFVKAADRSPELAHFGWTEVFSTEEKDKLFSSVFKESIKQKLLAENFVRAYEESLNREELERFLYMDRKTHLLDEFLVKVDRMSMANSLEVRPPFLDNEMVDFCDEIPVKYKIKGFSTKYLLRKLMKDRLPKNIIEGSKKGFSPPMGSWMAGQLYNYTEKKFSPDNVSRNPYLNKEEPLRLLKLHTSKKANLARPLWTLLMFIEWYERKVLV